MTDRGWYEPYLSRGEKLLWQGRPDPHEIFSTAEFGMALPMLLMAGWGGYILYLLYSAKNVPLLILLAFTGLVVLWLAYALYTGVGAPILRLLQLRGAAYAITDRRVLRRIGGLVEAMDGSTLHAPYLRKGAQHYGTITFGTFPLEANERYSRIPSMAIPASFELRGIPHAAQVMDVIASMTKERAGQPLSDRSAFPLEEGEKLLYQSDAHGGSLRSALRMTLDADRLFLGLWCTALGGAAVGMLIYAHASWPFLLPFGAVMLYGLYQLLFRGAHLHVRQRSESCAVTDRRVLVRMGRRIREYRPSPGDVVFMAQGRDGSGTVVVGNLEAVYALQARRSRRSHRVSMVGCTGFQLGCVADPARAMDALSVLTSSNKEE